MNRTGRNERSERVLWGTVAIVLCALAIPWFLWGNSTTVFGLPLWLWWHVGWMFFASVVFWMFAERAWGLGIETARTNGRSETGDSSARRTGGDRR